MSDQFPCNEDPIDGSPTDDVVRKPFHALNRAIDAVLRNHAVEHLFPDAVAEARALSDSPIESDMAAALICDRNTNLNRRPLIVGRGASIPDDGPPLIVIPQHAVGPYCVDFALISNAFNRRVVVECDGYEFHDRTVDAAVRDKMRDRYLLLHGWPVMHFNGAEIYQNVDACAAQVAAYLAGRWSE